MFIVPGKAAIRPSFRNMMPRRSALNLMFDGIAAFPSTITFTRASTATYYNSAGVLTTAAINETRIDYDPATLAVRGLLIEEQRTNLLTYSEQFDNAAWAKTRSSIAVDTATAPDGATTADMLVEDTTASSTHGMAGPSVSVVSGTAYTASVFIKASDTRRLQIILLAAAFGSNLRATFNVATGTVATNGGSATITPVSAGFYRCTFTATATATVSTSINLNLANADTADLAAITYTGNGTSGIYIWGAQLEAGAFATSYIPTVGSQVTRSADTPTMTGTNFSYWYNQPEGTFVFEGDTAAPAATASVMFVANDGTANERNQLSFGANVISATVTVGGVSQVTGLSEPAASANTVYKVAFAYKTNDFAMSVNGSTPDTDTSGSVPTPTQLLIGHRTTWLNGHIRAIRYYNTRLPDATLQGLSAL